MTQAGSPNPRNDRICITSSCPRQFVYSRRQQQLRFSVPLAANHNRPSHPCDLVGKCNCRHLCWSAIHYSCEPKSFRSVLSGVANDGHSAGDKQPSRFCLDLLARQYLTLVARSHPSISASMLGTDHVKRADGSKRSRALVRLLPLPWLPRSATGRLSAPGAVLRPGSFGAQAALDRRQGTWLGSITKQGNRYLRRSTSPRAT